jgi:carboxypeptidase Taq
MSDQVSSSAADESTDEVYEAFLEREKRRFNVGAAAGVLRWDQEVMMPEGGTTARSGQLSALSAIGHELLTDEEMADWIGTLRNAKLDDERSAVLREVGREYDRATSVPTDLVEEISAATSEAHPKWTEAKEESKFETFAPALEQLVELNQEYAEHIDSDRPAYEVLFEEYEPYLGVETADRVLTELRKGLVPLIEDIRESDVELASPFDGEYPADAQEALARTVLDELGYDWEHGRLDTAPHPFSTGTQFDARVTTRFDESDPIGALGSTIHEFGHARYTQGLPKDEYATPLGQSRDLTVHESQSRFWENHVGRTREFSERLVPLVQEHLPDTEDLTADELFQAFNQVYEDNLIRVEADELTYHLHIVARYEIEREIIAGDLAIEDVPEAWNDAYEEYLGIRPDNDAEGCLQDIHWSHGSFGYFPTYSLGSVLAAQIDAAMREDLDVDGLVADGEFDPIREWLREEIHQHGARYTTSELIEKATGEPLTAEYFLDYVEEKYGELYDL